MSGKLVRITLLLPPELKDQATREALRRGYASLSEYLRDLLRKDLAKG